MIPNMPFSNSWVLPYRYMELKFVHTLNECGVIACVQLLHTMPTRSEDKNVLNMLLHAKTITFGFMKKLTITGEAIDAASQDETLSESGRSNTMQLVADFPRIRLQETFRCLFEWIDSNSASSLRTVESILEELKERKLSLLDSLFTA